AFELLVRYEALHSSRGGTPRLIEPAESAGYPSPVLLKIEAHRSRGGVVASQTTPLTGYNGRRRCQRRAVDAEGGLGGATCRHGHGPGVLPHRAVGRHATECYHVVPSR